jgi:fused signal recognition particle receptor
LCSSDRELALAVGRPTTILVVGVNGTGKTTSVAKLAQLLKSQGSKVVVAAADTFRAAAIEQLQTWGQRIGVAVVVGKAQGDPAAVAFDAISKAKLDNADYLIIDTAGRLHTKSGLMDELEKIRRVVEKSSPVDEVLLIVDATTGQNGIAQAKVFAESVSVTGLIVTKMDGSAKGGIALAIERETGLPIKFVGTGESATDIQIFNRDEYLTGLLE